MLDFLKKKWIVIFGLIIAGIFLLGIRTSVPKNEYVSLKEYQAWPQEIIRSAEAFPIQDGGRTKPLLAKARLDMLAIVGRQKLTFLGKDEKEISITPTEWMMDCIWRPKFMAKVPMFVINNDEVIARLGGRAHEKRRDRYAYEELRIHLPTLRNLALQLSRIDSTNLSSTDRQILDLAGRIQIFEGLVTTMLPARQGISIGGTDAPDPLPKTPVIDRVSAWLENAATIHEGVAKNPDAARWARDIDGQFSTLTQICAQSPAIFLPDGLNTGKAFEICQLGKFTNNNKEEIIKSFALFEELALASEQNNLTEFGNKFIPFAQEKSQSQQSSLALEVSYYKLDPIFWSFIAFTFAFAAFCAHWLSPKSWWGKLTILGYWSGSFIGLFGLIFAISLRSIIMARPPVGNLYDTIPFITAGVIVVSLIMEITLRKKFPLFVGILLGVLGCALAIQYEAGNPVDTMDPLVAVLRDNYWLTTHVITITLGYSAGLLAAGISHVYLIGRMTGLDNQNIELRKSLTRMVYGSICFCLLLSLIGTVLGGVWANDSWGRFWGWDPKENGALMIVLATLAILHARLSGWIGELGIHIASAFCAIIIAFSWWYVNMLGVGLHSYGFTEGKSIVQTFFIIEALITCTALIYAWKIKKNTLKLETPSSKELS